MLFHLDMLRWLDGLLAWNGIGPLCSRSQYQAWMFVRCVAMFSMLLSPYKRAKQPRSNNNDNKKDARCKSLHQLDSLEQKGRERAGQHAYG